MNYKIISSSSKGNAVIINNTILIDVGVSFKQLADTYSKLKIVLLTHAHSDHFNKSTIKKLHFEKPTIRFVCGEWLLQPLLDLGIKRKRIDVVELGKTYDYTTFKLSPVELIHNVPNIGYKLFLGDKKLMYATDTNSLEHITAKDYDLYMIECNYIEEDIQARIQAKEVLGLYAYEKQVLKNHLSKTKCDNFIYSNIGAKGEYVYLHQHVAKAKQRSCE